MYTYTQGGVYTVTQWVTDTDTAEEAVLTRTHYITVYQAVEAGFAAEPTGGPPPLTVSFTNTTTGNYSASLWCFGDGVTGTLDSPTHTYTIPDVYTVTLSVEGLGGMDSLTRTHYITAYTPVEAGFRAAPRTGIAPLTVAFTNTTTGDYAASLWRFGDGLTSTLDSPEHVYTSGLFSVTLTASGPGGTDTLTYTRYISVSRLATTTIVYGYDPLYRLTSAAYSSGEVYTYTYDPVGNRLVMGADGQVVTYTYDTANRLTRVGQVVYTWDDNGNLLADGVRTYEYDHANRLVAVVSGTLATEFTYNGDGHRMSKTMGGTTTTYVVAVLGLPQVLVETTGSAVTRYVFGQDLLAEHNGTAWAYHLDDGLGSVRQLVSEDGRVTLAQGYAPYGEPLWSEGSGTTGFGFTGERWEAYTGLLFLRARYYEPGTGRFLARDLWPGSFALPSTLHGWIYVEDNPLRYVDPTGHIKETQEDQANEYVEYLSGQYGIKVKVDWGWKWRLVWACPPWQKVWDEGAWALPDLAEFRDGVDRFALAMGSGFRASIGQRLVIKGKFDRPGPGLQVVAETTREGGSITFYDYWIIKQVGLTFQEVVLHELAHVWDFRSHLALEKEFMLETGGHMGGFLGGIYTPGGEQPSIPLYGPGTILSLEEDFAWSATFYLSKRQLDEARVNYLSLKFPCFIRPW